MPRTQDRFYADAPHLGGWVFFGIADLTVLSTATAPAVTRNAEGDWSFNRTATGAETIRFRTNSDNMRRLLEFQDLMEQFGPAAGVPGPKTGPTATPGPVSVAGRPPYTGATQLVPPTAPPAKGVRIDNVVTIYVIGVAALTSTAIVMDETVFANNVANAITSMPLAAAPVLPTATQANPYVTVIPVTTPAFVTDDLSDVILEQTFVMQNTGTLQMYGLGMHVSFNFD